MLNIETESCLSSNGEKKWLEKLSTFWNENQAWSLVKKLVIGCMIYQLPLQLHVFRFVLWEVGHWAFWWRGKIIIFSWTGSLESLLCGILLHVFRNLLFVLLRPTNNNFAFSRRLELLWCDLWRYMAAASPFKGSVGLGYVRSWGRKDSKMLERS